MNKAQQYLAALYDEAKERIGRSLTIYNEVSDMLDRLDDGEQGKDIDRDYDQLCHRLREVTS